MRTRRIVQCVVLVTAGFLSGAFVFYRLRADGSNGDIDAVAGELASANTDTVQAYDIARCDGSSYLNTKSILLASPIHPDLTSSKAVFVTLGKYNPSLLALPPGSKPAYFGIARLGKMRHDIVWCLMDWKTSPVLQHRTLECVHYAKTLPLPHFKSWKRKCTVVPYLALEQGFLDPRVFYSPFGEPLMIVGSNSHIGCLGMYLIDLRALIPGLDKMLKLENVPIRYDKYVELQRPGPGKEIEKNWFMLWDMENTAYVQHDLRERSLSRFDDPTVNAAGTQPWCLKKLFSKFDGDGMMIHQATNSLRLTLCNYPCTPTPQNTVIITIVHVKIQRMADIRYNRHLVVMNATAPFHLIGRSRNLMYAGNDGRSFIYTVSMLWDTSVRKRRRYSEPERPAVESPAEEPRLEKRYKRVSKRPEAPYVLQSDLNVTSHLATQYSNPAVSDYYHGWMDDVIMINFGIKDAETAVIHVRPADLMNCLVLC